MEIPTIKIQDGKDDYKVINEDEFDEKKHKVFVEKETKTKDAKDDK